jgi:hypothetical protein
MEETGLEGEGGEGVDAGLVLVGFLLKEGHSELLWAGCRSEKLDPVLTDVVEVSEDAGGRVGVNWARWERGPERMPRMERKKRKGEGVSLKHARLKRRGSESPSAPQKMTGIGSL